VDAQDSVQEALAVRGGRIAYVGSNSGAKAYVGQGTHVVDLHGHVLMPGLVDGHMHPLGGGAQLLKCNLNYESLTVPQFQARIQKCLDDSRDAEPDQWLEVVNWFQQNMQPPGTGVTHETLDVLKTKRPIAVLSSFYHSVLANARALQLAQVTAKTPDPVGGKIQHDAKGEPNGILEDAAYQQVTRLIPEPTPAQKVKAAAAALEALRKQGITSFLDAAAEADTIEAFRANERAGALTGRAHFAVLIRPAANLDTVAAVKEAKAVATRYDEGALKPAPSITVRNVKLFLDGVITAPAFTGSMLTPYFVNQGTSEHPHWVPGKDRGPDVYFPAPTLKALLVQLAQSGLEPHMHTDGDRAVREALDAVEVLRQHFPESAIRAAMAHDEALDPADLLRYAKLGAIPVLSYQWEKPAPDTIEGARDYLGPARFKYLESAGYIAAAGARIAYGSDWPVDPLDEWFALKVAVTREAAPSSAPQYAGRLTDDPGLTLPVAVRGITANAAYELHCENDVGSLEAGKLADLIVLDRNVFKIPPREIADTKVLLTVVGGKVVYTGGPIQ
jgi:predicted amidohydrolase YtcJ